MGIAIQAHGVELDPRTIERLSTFTAADRAVLSMLGPYALKHLGTFFGLLDRFGGIAFAAVLALAWKARLDAVAHLAREQRETKRASEARKPEFTVLRPEDPPAASSGT